MNDEFKPKKASWREYDRQFITLLQSRPQDERSALAVRVLLGGLEVSENRRSLPKTYFPSPKSDAEREGRIALATQLRTVTVHPSTLKLLADLIDPDTPHGDVPRAIKFEFRKQGGWTRWPCRHACFRFHYRDHNPRIHGAGRA